MFQIKYTYKNISDRDKKIINDYLPKKVERFETLLKHFENKEVWLDVKAETFATKAAHKIELALHIPGNILRAAEDDHTLNEAIDLAVDKLIVQLRKLVNR